MSRLHSFFIPDRDILIDLPGLLSYLGEKIAIGNLCLYCPNGGREFGSIEAVRKHMIDKAHCKLAYDAEEDRVELADFYDYAGDGSQSDWEDMDDEDMQIGVSGTSVTADMGRCQRLPAMACHSFCPPAECSDIAP